MLDILAQEVVQAPENGSQLIWYLLAVLIGGTGCAGGRRVVSRVRNGKHEPPELPRLPDTCSVHREMVRKQDERHAELKEALGRIEASQIRLHDRLDRHLDRPK